MERSYSEGLELICGGSGSGKTTRMYTELIEASVKHPERYYIVLVPEQTTLLTQQKLLAMHPDHILMNIDILSFQRLAYRLQEELHLEIPAILDDTGKMMILRHAAASCRRDLTVFGDSLDLPGFLDELKSLLTELTQYEITDDQLQELEQADDCSALLKRKLHDLRILSDAFRSEMEDRFMMAEELMAVLRDHVKDSKLISDTLFYLDGFTGFTPLQYDVIRELLIYSCGVHCEMVIRPEELSKKGSEHELFAMSREMRTRLERLADETHAYPIRTVQAGDHSLRFDGGALAHLEHYYGDAVIPQYEGECPEICLLSAKDPEAEVRKVAGRIRDLVNCCGYRMREIAVVTGDMERYSGIISRIFGEAGFSFFMDEKRNMTGHPSVEAIRAGLEAVGTGYRYEEMFHFLRTGMIPIDRMIVDRMENYCLALGINGKKRWEEPWTRCLQFGKETAMSEEELAELEAGRNSVMTFMAPLEEIHQGKELTVRERLTLLYQFLVDCRLDMELKQMQKELEDSGMTDRARSYGQLFEKICNLFDRFVELMGDDVIPFSQFCDVLEAGFEGMKIGVVPSTLDRIVVGDLKRTRLGEIRALFVVGVNEGIIPSDVNKGGILSEPERQIFEDHQVELAPDARKEIFTQRYYLYRMLTKPSERLVLSWAVTSPDGKAIRPSELVTHFRQMFPMIREDSGKELLPTSEEESFLAAAEGLRELHDGTERENLKAYLAYCEHVRPEFLSAIVGASELHYREEALTADIAFRLYGSKAFDSVTRLENFAACQYAHFLNYGMNLSERRAFELSSQDYGSMYHRIIQLFNDEIEKEGLALESLTEEDRERIIDLCLEAAIDEGGREIYRSTAKNLFLYNMLKHSVDRNSKAIVMQIREGDYRVWKNELGFHREQQLELPGGARLRMNLKGKIDRVDVGRIEDRIYTRVIDYKTGTKEFDLTLFRNGIQMQLPLYLASVPGQIARAEKVPEDSVHPGGFYYYMVDDPYVADAVSAEEAEKACLKKLCLTGITNASEDSQELLHRSAGTNSPVIKGLAWKKDGDLGKRTAKTVYPEPAIREITRMADEMSAELGTEIYSGAIAVNPYEYGQNHSCDYCAYRSVCGFERGITGFRYRKLKEMKPEELFPEQSDEEEEGEQ